MFWSLGVQGPKRSFIVVGHCMPTPKLPAGKRHLLIFNSHSLIICFASFNCCLVVIEDSRIGNQVLRFSISPTLRFIVVLIAQCYQYIGYPASSRINHPASSLLRFLLFPVLQFSASGIPSFHHPIVKERFCSNTLVLQHPNTCVGNSFLLTRFL